MSLRVSPEPALKELAGAVVLSECRTKEGSPFKLTRVVVGRIQFLVDSWTKGLHYSLAVGQRLPSVLCHVVLSNMIACFIEANKRESAS